MTTNTSKNKIIKIVTYNIFLFSNPQVIVHNILIMKEQGVDVFCLQEIVKAEGKPFVGDAVLKMLGEGWDIEYSLGSDDTTTSHGVAVVWNKRKLQKVASKKMILPSLTKLSFANKLMRYVTRFKEIKIENKALCLDFLVGKKKVRVTSVHISLSARNPQHRLKQHAFLMKQLEAQTVPYEVICGDFNSLRGKTYKKEMRSIQNLYGKDFSEVCSEIAWTQDLHYSRLEKAFFNWIIIYSNLHYRQHLDHIFVKGFTPLECERLDLKGSDHFPLVTTLVFT